MTELILPPAEEWRDCSSIEFSWYVVSNYGRVWSRIKNICLQGTVSGYGYLEISLQRDDGKAVKTRVHRLVALIFLGERPAKGWSVDHIDRNKLNNCAWNLRWASQSEQSKNTVKPENHMGRAVYQFSLEGQLVFRWNRLRDACVHYGLSENAIGLAANKNQSCAGFYWIRADDHEVIEGEVFLQIPGFSSCRVSNFGRVALSSGRITTGSVKDIGYARISIFPDGAAKRKSVFVHILVMRTFVGEPGNMLVNHKNGRKNDNRLENLEYVTAQGNIRHAYSSGLTKTPKGKDNKHAVAVVRYNRDWSNPLYFGSLVDAARESGMKMAVAISAVCRGKSRHYTAGGYIWRYWKDVAHLYVAGQSTT